jgi:hypothetical protein
VSDAGAPTKDRAGGGIAGALDGGAGCATGAGEDPMWHTFDALMQVCPQGMPFLQFWAPAERLSSIRMIIAAIISRIRRPRGWLHKS